MAAEAVNTGQVISPYLAIVCDERQDVSASDLRLMAALSRDTTSGKTRPNSLFLVGDRYQSLYRSPVSLTSCGIEVRGRACTLRRNYRTTEGIRRAAIKVVEGISFDDVEMQGDGEDETLQHYTSVRQGAPPQRQHFETPEAEADWIALQTQQEDGWPLLVLTRTNAWQQALDGRLRALGVNTKCLGAHESLSSEDRVVLCSMHRAKGLEAPRVIIAGMHLVPRPWRGKGDLGDKRIWERQERCLLYVAMTRARDWCALTGVRRARADEQGA
jgi:superfamily I DNA/RNA helicase